MSDIVHAGKIVRRSTSPNYEDGCTMTRAGALWSTAYCVTTLPLYCVGICGVTDAVITYVCTHMCWAGVVVIGCTVAIGVPAVLGVTAHRANVCRASLCVAMAIYGSGLWLPRLVLLYRVRGYNEWRPFGIGPSLILVSLMSGGPVAIALVAHTAYGMWRRRASPCLCAMCGYNLTGNTSGRCPECGTAQVTLPS